MIPTVPRLLPQVQAHLPEGLSTAVAVVRSHDGESWLPVRFSRFDADGSVLADGCYVIYQRGRDPRRIPPAYFRLLVASERAKVVASQGGYVVRSVRPEVARLDG